MRLQAGNAEDVAKYAKRTVRVTQQHNDECKRLLELMGVPIINVSLPVTALQCMSSGLGVCAMFVVTRTLPPSFVSCPCPQGLATCQETQRYVHEQLHIQVCDC